MRQTRLYHKGSRPATYERFDTDAACQRRCPRSRGLFSCWAPRAWCRQAGTCHLYDLLIRVGGSRPRADQGILPPLRQHARKTPSSTYAGRMPTCPGRHVLSGTQKLLDRILFCAFCEDRGLLPAETIRKAYEHSDPYNPRPVWENFRGLFRSINVGNDALNIPATTAAFSPRRHSGPAARPRRGLRAFPRAGRLRLPPGPCREARRRRGQPRQLDRRGHPRPHLRAIDHRPGKTARRAGRPRPARRPGETQEPPQERRRVLHPRLHHPLHRRASPRQRTARPIRGACESPNRPTRKRLPAPPSPIPALSTWTPSRNPSATP